jgi:hypothetical protein
MWGRGSYIVPRRATLETRRWATPRDPPSVGHPPSGTRPPPTGARPLSVGHPPECPSALHTKRVPSIRRATPSGIEFISSASLLTVVFIHFQDSSSTDHKMHPLSRKLITCSEISSSVEKFHPLFKKCTYCVASSSFAYQIHPLCHFLSEGIRKIIHGKPRNLQ